MYLPFEQSPLPYKEKLFYALHGYEAGIGYDYVINSENSAAITISTTQFVSLNVAENKNSGALTFEFINTSGLYKIFHGVVEMGTDETLRYGAGLSLGYGTKPNIHAAFPKLLKQVVFGLASDHTSNPGGQPSDDDEHDGGYDDGL